MPPPIPMNEVTRKIFDSFVGRWSIQRQICDKMSNSVVTANGSATFQEVPPSDRTIPEAAEIGQRRLIYSEDVLVKWAIPNMTDRAIKQYK